MGEIKLRTASWNRFLTRSLFISYEILGSYHEFQFQGYLARIELPQEASYFTLPVNEQARAIIFSWQEDEGTKIPIDVEINSVDVVVQLREDVIVPIEILQVPLNAYELLSKRQQKYLNDLTLKYKAIAERAFDLWIRTLRWKTNSSNIGRPEVRDHLSGWATYLLEAQTRKRFWSSPRGSLGTATTGIEQSTWDDAQRALQLGLEPPIFYDLIFDTVKHLERGDLPRAVVDAAVACESYLRKLVMHEVPADLRDSLKKFIDEANIRQVMNHFVPDMLDEDERKVWKKINPDLQKLFNDSPYAVIGAKGCNELD